MVFLLLLFLCLGVLDLISALSGGARLVNRVIVTLEAQEYHFGIDTEPVFQCLADLHNGLLRLGLVKPHRDLVSPVPHVDHGTVDQEALPVE